MRNLLCETQTWNFSCVPSAFALNCLQMKSAFFGTQCATGLLQQFRRLFFCCGISRSSFLLPPHFCSLLYASPLRSFIVRKRSATSLGWQGSSAVVHLIKILYNIGCSRIVPCSGGDPQSPRNISGTFQKFNRVCRGMSMLHSVTGDAVDLFAVEFTSRECMLGGRS